MTEISSEQAITRARRALGVPESVAARAFRVERLDAPAAAYFLVLFSSGGRVRHVATIDAGTGALQDDADIAGDHLMLTREQAIAAAGLGGAVQAKLVWRPGPASRSSLYPIWEISSPKRRRYVDQQGQLWDILPSSGRGGGGP
jgi:hypothetical protein